MIILKGHEIKGAAAPMGEIKMAPSMGAAISKTDCMTLWAFPLHVGEPCLIRAHRKEGTGLNQVGPVYHAYVQPAMYTVYSQIYMKKGIILPQTLL